MRRPIKPTHGGIMAVSLSGGALAKPAATIQKSPCGMDEPDKHACFEGNTYCCDDNRHISKFARELKRVEPSEWDDQSEQD